MRVGFVTQLLWPRYGAFWQNLVAEVGGEPRFATPDMLKRPLQDDRVARIPGLCFRLAAAQALALAESDLLIVPDLNPGEEVPRGGGQDPWVASFPEALAQTVGGLPPIRAVPASLEGNLETLAFTLLHGLSGDAGRVRRAYERHRRLAVPPRHHEPRQQGPGAIGVLGQPWLVTDALLERLKVALETSSETNPETGVQLIAQHQLDPAVLREEGARDERRLVATDREVLGAARLLGRRGSVSRLLLVVDQTSGVDAWLQGQVERVVRKPLETIALTTLVADPLELAALP